MKLGWLKKVGKVVAYPVTKPVAMLTKKAVEAVVNDAADAAKDRITREVAALVPPPPPLLGTPQGVIVKNWRTTLIGLGIGSAYAVVSGLGSGLSFKDALMAAGIAALGTFAKDAGVTGVAK